VDQNKTNRIKQNPSLGINLHKQIKKKKKKKKTLKLEAPKRFPMIRQNKGIKSERKLLANQLSQPLSETKP
jgi:hypothetical protein